MNEFEIKNKILIDAKEIAIAFLQFNRTWGNDDSVSDGDLYNLFVTSFMQTQKK